MLTNDQTVQFVFNTHYLSSGLRDIVSKEILCEIENNIIRDRRKLHRFIIYQNVIHTVYTSRM